MVNNRSYLRKPDTVNLSSDHIFKTDVDLTEPNMSQGQVMVIVEEDFTPVSQSLFLVYGVIAIAIVTLLLMYGNKMKATKVK
jgi:hypothetical protein